MHLETRLARRQAALGDLLEAATCERGDIQEYRNLVGDEPPVTPSPRRVLDDGLSRLRPGDVIRLEGGKSAGPVAVLTVARRRGGTVRLRVITAQRRVMNLGSGDFARRPEVLSHLTLPTPFAPSNRTFQREVARALAGVDVHTRTREVDDEEAVVTSSGPAHPVAGCPDLDQHLRAARQAERAAREVADLARQIQGRTESLARRFDQVLRLLEAWGHLDGWALTERGERLVRIFHESDLLVAEALETGLLDDLDPASLAGMVSCLTYEHRSPNPPDAPWFPSAEVRRRVMALDQLAADLNLDEQAAGLPLSRPPDPGFFALAYAWAAGEALDDVLADEDLSGGDFVRNVKLLIDLLGQVAEAAPDPTTARTARQATDQILRGVVAASSVAGDP